MGSAFRTGQEALSDRLDSTYYLPRLLQNEHRLHDSGLPLKALGHLVSKGRRVIYIDTQTVESKNAPSSWVKWITSDDFADEGFFINIETRLRVSQDFARSYPKGRLRAGELLIKVKGPNQLAAYVETVSANRIVMLSGTIWGAIVNKDIVNPLYLVAILESPYGRTARTRRRVNTNIEFVSPADLMGIMIPLPPSYAQAYIGQKVLKAEALRFKATGLMRQIEAISEAAIGLSCESRNTRNYRMISNELAHRLDAKFYSPAAHTVRMNLRARSITIRDLGPEVSNGFESRSFVENGRPYLTVSEVSSGHLLIDKAPRIPLEVKVPRKATVTPQSVLVVRTGSIGTAVLAAPEDSDACLSSHLVRLEFEKREIAAAVSTFLNCPHGKALQCAAAYGAVQPQIGQEDLLDIPIPTALIAVGHQLKELSDLSETAYQCSRRLTAAARLLVEALIERKVSEDELIAAHTDPAKDRELLSRLTPKGIDVPGEPPLFPDLDVLNQLLSTGGVSS